MKAKVIFRSVLPACAVTLLAACGGTTNTAATVPASAGEFDPATGGWKPLSRTVKPPPPQEGAVIARESTPGMMGKVGTTLKKPLKWVGLAKDEPPVVAEPAAAPAKKPAP
jgi:hypothetical protein